MQEATISVVDSKSLLAVLGARDQHLKQIREALGVHITARQEQIRIQGEEPDVARATTVLEGLSKLVEKNGAVGPDEVTRLLSDVTGGAVAAPTAAIEVMAVGRQIRPRTDGQRRYVEAIERHDLVFCEGPAGTGKTYLAVAMAAAALKRERIRKIVLVRPAVEAGESLGFLPGDLHAKINPYLRPLLDALNEMMDFDQVKRYTEQDVIEVIPLAYMRGRTLNDAFIILDEAQNTTVSQMKMFLTRMGTNSKIVVSGDATQVDLPAHTRSGLLDAMGRLKHIGEISQMRLTKADIVRNRLVQEIVQAYEEGPKKRH